MGSTSSVHYGKDVEDEYATYEEALTSYILIVLATAVSILTLVFALYHVFKTQNIKIKYKWNTIALLSSLSLNILYCLRQMWVEHVNIMTDDFVGCVEVPSGYYIPASQFLGLARLCLYLFYLTRLKIIFHKSAFDFKPQTYTILAICMCTTVILAIINYELQLYISNCDRLHYLIGVGFAALQDTFWSVLLCYWFIKRLNLVTGLINTNKGMGSSTVDDDDGLSTVESSAQVMTPTVTNVNPPDKQNTAHLKTPTSTSDNCSDNLETSSTIRIADDGVDFSVNIDTSKIKSNLIENKKISKLKSVSLSRDMDDTNNDRNSDNLASDMDSGIESCEMEMSSVKSKSTSIATSKSNGNNYNKKAKKYKKIHKANKKLFFLCRKMTIITCTTCITTIMSTLLTGWLINVAVTTTFDIAINGICILFPFAFMNRYFDVICCCCKYVCKSI